MAGDVIDAVATRLSVDPTADAIAARHAAVESTIRQVEQYGQEMWLAYLEAVGARRS